MGRLAGLFCILVAFAALVVACGDDGNKGGGSNCAGDEVFVGSIGSDEINDCLKTCDDGTCASGFVCKGAGPRVCAPSASTNNTAVNSNSGTNSTTPNSTTANNTTPNNTSTNNMPTAAQIQLCEDVCNLFVGDCLRDTCTIAGELATAVDDAYNNCVNGDGTTPTCAQELASDASLESTYQDFLANTTCADRKVAFCGQFGLIDECSCAAPGNVGAACADDTACQGGDLQGFCASDQGIPDGYCLAGPCPSDGLQDGDVYTFAGCGTGNICSVSTDPMTGTNSGVCLDGCSAAGDCRTGYVCALQGFGQDEAMNVTAVRACLPPVCMDNTNCPMGFRCNSGVCELPCSDMDAGNGQTIAEICVATGGTCTPDGAGGEFCVFP